MNEHPSKDIVGSDGNELEGKRIVLCITASVAAYKAVELARMLMRHGADVRVVMTESAKILLTPELMHWATGNEVVSKLTSELEHIKLADYGRSDLILIYPCTGNTLSKIAHGIDDTPVTSIASVALGSRIPLIIAPAMHEAMYENPLLKRNITLLEELGIEFVEPDLLEKKAKIADPAKVLDHVMHTLNTALKGKNVLVTAGSTVEHIDPIRVLTNISSGKFGVAIARAAYRLGANVTLLYGYGTAEPPLNCKVIRVKTADDMLNAIQSELYDIAIMAAAVADYKPVKKREEKIETRGESELLLHLTMTEKIIDKIKKINTNAFLVAFKALYNVSDEVLIESALEKMKESNADLVVANDVGRRGSEMGSDTIEALIIDRSKNVKKVELQSKESAARILLQEIISRII